MNLTEFRNKTNQLNIEGYKPEDVKILITKSTGDTIIAAIADDNILDYFKI